jgi:hypothetical protein
VVSLNRKRDREREKRIAKKVAATTNSKRIVAAELADMISKLMS